MWHPFRRRSSALPTEAQRRELCVLLHQAILEIGSLARQQEIQQVAALADAVHNLPDVMYDPRFTWSRLQEDLQRYQSRYPRHEVDYLAMLARIRKLQALQGDQRSPAPAGSAAGTEPSEALLTEAQRRDLCLVLFEVLLELRFCGWQNESEQATALATAAHELPLLGYASEPTWSSVREKLQDYQAAYPRRDLPHDYVAMLAGIRKAEPVVDRDVRCWHCKEPWQARATRPWAYTCERCQTHNRSRPSLYF